MVGAGLSGLVAARELEARGCTVTVLEARDRIGGRVWVQRDALAGLDLDMGGAWVADCQPSVWAEADRYGVARRARPASRPDALGARRRADRPRVAGRRRRPRRARAHGRPAARRGAAPRPRAPARRAGARGPRRPRLRLARRPGRRRARARAGRSLGRRVRLRPGGRRLHARVPPLDLCRRLVGLAPSRGRRARVALPGRDRGPLRGDRRGRPRARSGSRRRWRRSRRTPTAA